MTTTDRLSRTAGPLPRSFRLLLRLGRSRELPPRCSAGLVPDVPVALADGTVLRAHHFVPDLPGPRPTVLVISPYGRGFPFGYLFGAQFARQGFHALVVSARGTAGSGGEWRPFRGDVADAADVVTWLRRQVWFDGRLGTVGPSYLGYTQLAVAAGAPPELRAMVLLAPVAEPAAAHWTHGVFALESALVAGLGVEFFSQGLLRTAAATIRAARRIPRAAVRQPLVDAYRPVFGRPSPVFEEFLTSPDPQDPHWAGTDLGDAVTAAGADVLLVGGWWDILLDQTLALYARAERAGRAPHLLVGPWTHTSMTEAAGWPEVFPSAVAFLRSRLDDGADGPRVRVHVGGDGGGWREQDAWPPTAAEPTTWTLAPDGGLLPTAELSFASSSAPSSASSVIAYDPTDPTPSAGGATLGRPGGVVDNRAVEARDDVLVFTSAPLDTDVEVLGPVSARLTVRVAGEAADLFVRLCDVDPEGVSRNVCDGIVRLDAAVFGPDGGAVTVPMSATAHRFARGRRLRVQVSGAAHPRFARSTGTAEPLATAVRLAPATIELLHAPPGPAVILPCVPPGPGVTPGPG